MKTRHFLMIIIPVAISIIVIAFFVIPYALPVQPLTVQVIGYRTYTCNNSTNSCVGSTPILFGDGDNIFHKGDQFSLVVSVTNPNFFPINFDSAFSMFDKNSIEHPFFGCAGLAEEIGVMAIGTNQITIPNSSCDIYIANSVGKINAMVFLEYKIKGISYSINASKILTVLP